MRKGKCKLMFKITAQYSDVIFYMFILDWFLFFSDQKGGTAKAENNRPSFRQIITNFILKVNKIMFKWYEKRVNAH
jgi:hypothetical protein